MDQSIPSQDLIHLNDHPVGPIAPYVRLGASVGAPKIVKVWTSWETAIASTLTVDQLLCC